MFEIYLIIFYYPIKALQNSFIIATCRSPDDEYYSNEYYEDDEEPTDVWGYVLNEAVKQTFGSGANKDQSTDS